MKEETTYIKGMRGCYIKGQERDIIIGCLVAISRNADESTKTNRGIFIEKFFLKNGYLKDRLACIKKLIRKIDF
jgi:hypothetical protein